MQPPIIVSEHGEVVVFESIETAARGLEPIDVRNGEYIAYDSEGFLLTLVASEPRITISGRLDQPARPEELRQALVDFIESVDNGTEQTKPSSLVHLLAYFIQRFGYTV